MRTFLDFLRKYNYFFVFLLLEAVSLTILFRFNSFQGSVWFTAANDAVAGINRWYADGLSYMNLGEVNRELTAQNVALAQQNATLRELLANTQKDSTITNQLMMERLKGYTLIPATVVSNETSRANNYIVIDRGSEDGVRPEMGVVSGRGVVGIVYLAAAHHALVIPVTNRKSSISCRVRGQNYFGFLQWSGGNLFHADVNDIPRYARVHPGAIVETSGYSAVFPPGLFVGRVRKLENSADGQSYKLRITLGTNFRNLRNVEVIATPYKSEIDTLRNRVAQQEAQDAMNGGLTN